MKQLDKSVTQALWIAVATLGILGGLTYLQLHQTGFRPMQRLENLTFDWRVKATPLNPDLVSTNLAMIFLDDHTAEVLGTGVLGSHRNYGQYRTGLPVPRYIHGDFLDLIQNAEPSLICFDILFPDRRDDHPSFSIPGGGIIASDEIFANDLLTSGNVVLAMTDGLLPDILFRDSCHQIGHISAEPDFDGILRRIKPIQKAKVWHEIFEIMIAEDAGLPTEQAIVEKSRIYWQEKSLDGSPPQILFEIELDDQGRFDVLNPKFDYDGQSDEFVVNSFGGIRYHKPFEEKSFWHMGFLMAASQINLQLDKAEFMPDSHQIHIPDSQGNILKIPLDAENNMVINWKLRIDSPQIPKASLSDFFDSTMNSPGFFEMWKNKSILLGSNASGNNLRDIASTPVSPKDFAMMTHLNIANSLINRSFIHSTSNPATLCITAFAILIASILSLQLKGPWDSILLLIIASIYTAFTFISYSRWGLWIPVAMPVMGGLGLTHILNVANRAAEEQKEKSRIRRIFGQTVSPNVVNVLLKEDSSQIRGSSEIITTIFSDIRGFTDMTDSLESRSVSHAVSLGLTGSKVDEFVDFQTRSMLEAVNEHLSIQAESIKIYNGTLDKYIGDCVMAFWGAPTADPLHALHCVYATVASHKAMLQINIRRESHNKQLLSENPQRLKNGLLPIPLKPMLDMGAGINSGKALVGLIGSTRHISNYTVFGRTVNLAARLEGTSGRGRIRIGESTRNDLIKSNPDFNQWLKSHPPTFLKGFSEAIPSYEVLWWKIPHSVVPIPPIHEDTSSNQITRT